MNLLLIRIVRVAFTGAIVLWVIVATADGSLAGDYLTRTVQWEGTERSYLLHLPPDTKTAPLPLVIALHGAGGDAASFAEETHFAAAADASGMMVAFPEGTPGANGGRAFNAQFCCGEAVTRQVDDVGFVGAVIEDVARQHPLDRARIYATGMSNGGMLAYVLAATRPEWFAAIAPVAGAIGGMTRNGRTYLIPMPHQPVSVMIVHGMRDRLVLYDGGSSPYLKFPNHWKLSVADAFSFWATVDHCDGAPEIREPVPGTLKSMAYTACAANSTVRLWTIEDGDHAWPGDVFPHQLATHSAAAEILAFFATTRRDEPAVDTAISHR